MTRKLIALSLLLLFSIYSTNGIAQNIIYVDSANVGGINNGNSWTTAYNNFQIAIDNANAGDSIFVAKGTYQLAYNVSFIMKDSVKIYGGFSALNPTFSTRDWDLNKTILRGNNDRVIDNQTNNLSPAAKLDGFIITNGSDTDGGGMSNIGSSPTLSNLIFIDNSAIGSGGGMYNDNSSPSMDNISFIDNYANNGGGMLNYNNSNPIVTNSFFILNNSTRGGGMYNAESSPLVTNVIFEGNSGYDFGGGMYNNNNSSPALNDIVFSGNTSNSTGGGMLNSTSLPTLNNVIFYNNSANYFGGGVHNTSYSHVAMNNVAFINNSSGRGGGVSNYQSSPTLTNVTFSGNISQYTGAVLNNSYYSYPKLKNTLIWGNSGAIGVDVSNAPNSSATITYSYTQSALPGTGNIQGITNPFINDSIPMGADGIWMTADDGLALSCNSPASNVGKNSYVNSGITTDITGAARISGGIVDMGAYENPFNVNITGNTSFCAGNPISDTLIADVGGGVGPYTYSWNTASTNDSILINALGTYFVSVTDTNACVISDTVNLSEYSPNVSIIGDTAFCTGAVIMDTLVVNVNGGNAPYSYLWNTSSTNDSIPLNTAGNYSVTVTDASGCSNADTVQITEYLPNVNIIGNAEFCDGTTETLVANVTGEVGPSTFLWNNSATNNNISLNTGGTYSVTVTDVNGCSNADTLQVTLNSLPIVSINGNNTFCFNESEILTANVVGAANPFTFLWNTSSTNNSITVNTGGNYSVTVTDVNGCADTETIQVQ